MWWCSESCCDGEHDAQLLSRKPAQAYTPGGHRKLTFEPIRRSASGGAKPSDESYLAQLAGTGQPVMIERFLKSLKSKKSEFNINWQNPGDKKKTCLHVAAIKGHSAACLLLVQHGAQPLKDADGLTPADLAESLGHDALAKNLRQMTVEAPGRTQSQGSTRRVPVIHQDQINKAKEEEYKANLQILRTSSGQSSTDFEGRTASGESTSSDKDDGFGRTQSAASSTTKTSKNKQPRPSSAKTDKAQEGHLWGKDYNQLFGSQEQGETREGITTVDGQDYADDNLDEVIALHHFYGGTNQDKNYKDLQIYPGKKLLLVEMREGWCICKTKSGLLGSVPSSYLSRDGVTPIRGSVGNSSKSLPLLSVLKPASLGYART
mmetsp:Transcript_31604/g.49507  ORF Transcript_31604/g.49507 Transcript_31604/m.49507 type:complete len:376 (+) Transcript_31604:96-1223(+)